MVTVTFYINDPEFIYILEGKNYLNAISLIKMIYEDGIFMEITESDDTQTWIPPHRIHRATIYPLH